MRSYVALIRKEEGSDYGVEFPDFPGCATAGHTMDEARRMAEEALAFHIEGLLMEGHSLPNPSPLDEVALDSDRGAALFLIGVAEPRQGRDPVAVQLSNEILSRIDDWTARHGGSRLSFLENAVLDALKRAETV